VYGTAGKDADWDVTIIVEDACRDARTAEDKTIVLGNIDANVFNQSEWQDLINQHDMRALVCLFLPSQHVWKQAIDFSLSFACDKGENSNTSNANRSDIFI
jgi:hypothetical protein